MASRFVEFFLCAEKENHTISFSKNQISRLPCLPGEALAKPGSNTYRVLYRRVSPYRYLSCKVYVLNARVENA